MLRRWRIRRLWYGWGGPWVAISPACELGEFDWGGRFHVRHHPDPAECLCRVGFHSIPAAYAYAERMVARPALEVPC